ncbi:MAG: T9SS type A sorting domain-containing protein [Bacteroidota bacterium]|nr:T9SS type A sorting domain-containing protein [Bacteroidota bacterium]
MKKLYIILLLFTSTAFYKCYGQIDTIPNGGFEHWEGQQNCQYYIPKPWENYCTDYTGFIFTHLLPHSFEPYKDTATLYLFSPNDKSPNFVEQTFIIHSRPKAFSMIAGYNSGIKIAGFNVVILMLKGKDTVAYNNESSDPKYYRYLGDTVLPFDFIFPIKYYNNNIPDYCYIRLNSVSRQYTNFTKGGGTLYADNVKFLDTVMEKGVWHPDTTTHNDTTTHTDTTKHTSIYYTAAPPPQLTVWPNPSSGEVSFSFKATGNGLYTLTIYDITGRLVSTPIKQTLQTGSDTKANWDCPNCNSGIYTYILQSPSGVQAGKVVLVK